jgi:adenine deaminase
MSFLSLLVVPRLKIGDRGLFDVDASRFVDAVIPNPSRG